MTCVGYPCKQVTEGEEVLLNYDVLPNCSLSLSVSLLLSLYLALSHTHTHSLPNVVQVMREGEEVLSNYDVKPNCNKLGYAP